MIQPSLSMRIAAAIFLLVGVFALDRATPQGIPLPILYVLPLALISTLPIRSAPSWAAALASLATVAGYFLSPPLAGVPFWLPITNRVLSVILFCLCAVLIRRHRDIQDHTMQLALLEAQNSAHRLKQDALRKQAAEIEDLYNHAPCGYHSLDINGCFVAVNDTELQWLGHTREELLGRPFSDLLDDQGRQRFRESFPRFVAQGSVHDVEFDLLRKDGSTMPVLLSATAIRDAAGQYVASRSTLVDLTDRRQRDEAIRLSHEQLEALVRDRTAELADTNRRLAAQLEEGRRIEQALRASESRFRLMADHAPVLIWVTDPTKACTWLNKPWLDFVGCPLDQELGMGWTDHVHPDDVAGCIETYVQSFDARRPFTREYRLRRHDGEWRWLLDQGVPRYESEGAFAGYIGSCVDITDRRRAVEALRESEERLSGIIGSAMDAIMTVNGQRRIATFNRAAERMFGRSAEEVLGQPVNLLLPERLRQSHHDPIVALRSTAVRGDRSGQVETIYGLRADGEEFPIEASISQLFAQGEEIHTVILRDISDRRRAEEALQASERRFRELVESLPQLVWTCGPDGSCDYLSPQWIAYLGQPEASQLGLDWLNALHPDDRGPTAAEWNATVHAGLPFGAEFRIRRADGQYRWFQAGAVPVRDAHRQIIKWLGTNTDIDDRKRSEELQARLAAIVESSADAIISLSLDGVVHTWNQGAAQMLGFGPEEMIGRSIFSSIPVARHAEERRLLEGVHRDEHIAHYESVRLRTDGKTVDVLVTISPIRDALGRPISVAQIARDITTRKRTEETLLQKSLLIELSHEPILAWTHHQGIIEWNRGCEHLYGFTRTEALGQPCRDVLRPLYPEPIEKIMATVAQTGEWSGELSHRTKDGRELIVESRWGCIERDGQRIILETNRDVTERKKAELTLLKKNKDLETLLYVTSHDLKEPLRAIESFTQLVQERYADRLDEKGKDYLWRVVRATQRLDRLLTDILELSRAQRMEPPMEEIEATTLVKDALKRLDMRIKEAEAQVKICQPLPRLRVNRTWATQGLYNLLANALKFTAEGQAPDIEIAAYESDQPGQAGIGLVVRDRGPGVPDRHADRIFQLFQRAVGRHVEGTGAGLAIVRQVAERHGGQAWVQSRPGGGSEFVITFGEATLTGVQTPHEHEVH